MKLRWYIETNGNKHLQYFDGDYWRDIDIELEVITEWNIQKELRDKIRELEKEVKIVKDMLP